MYKNMIFSALAAFLVGGVLGWIVAGAATTESRPIQSESSKDSIPSTSYTR